MVEGVIPLVVVRREDGGRVEEERGYEVEGSCAGFAGEHELG